MVGIHGTIEELEAVLSPLLGMTNQPDKASGVSSESAPSEMVAEVETLYLMQSEANHRLATLVHRLDNALRQRGGPAQG